MVKNSGSSESCCDGNGNLPILESNGLCNCWNVWINGVTTTQSLCLYQWKILFQEIMLAVRPCPNCVKRTCAGQFSVTAAESFPRNEWPLPEQTISFKLKYSRLKPFLRKSIRNLSGFAYFYCGGQAPKNLPWFVIWILFLASLLLLAYFLNIGTITHINILMLLISLWSGYSEQRLQTLSFPLR